MRALREAAIELFAQDRVAEVIAPKNSAWARATFSQSATSVTYIRVRTTSESDAPARSRADWMFRRVCTAWS